MLSSSDPEASSLGVSGGIPLYSVAVEDSGFCHRGGFLGLRIVGDGSVVDVTFLVRVDASLVAPNCFIDSVSRMPLLCSICVVEDGIVLCGGRNSSLLVVGLEGSVEIGRDNIVVKRRRCGVGVSVL